MINVINQILGMGVTSEFSMLVTWASANDEVLFVRVRGSVLVDLAVRSGRLVDVLDGVAALADDKAALGRRDGDVLLVLAAAAAAEIAA
jgi:hypothetical protein